MAAVMRDLRPQLSQMFIFCRIVQNGSLAGAARELKLSRSLISETLSELEDQLGVRLLERTTRKLQLTQAGQNFFARSEQLIAEAEAALGETSQSAEQAVGVLRVATSSVLLPQLVGPVLAELSQRQSLRAELIVDDQRRDLVAEGFDVCVRIGVPTEAGFVMRRLGVLPEVLVASPALLSGIDIHDLEQVSKLPWLAHAVTPSVLQLVDEQGTTRSLSLSPRIFTNSGIGQRAMALAGAGATMAILGLVAEDLQAGRLVRLLPRYRLHEAQVFLLMPSTRQLPMRTRLFVDAMNEVGPRILTQMQMEIQRR